MASRKATETAQAISWLMPNVRGPYKCKRTLLANVVSMRDEREAISDTWQARWDEDTKGRWTQRLMPNIKRWTSKPPMATSSHITQALTGHGCFRSYLKRMKRAEDNTCCYCLNPDTMKYTISEFAKWNTERDPMALLLRHPVRAEDAKDLLCGPPTADLPDDPAARAAIQK
ncbi:Hypothetical protein CINCED_3A014497 [Cinara cedri]|uniref:Uncharacterized protein n=1 Tax=Cinara cedri TaxID=506608 RepID=A0A5E4MNN8_9HEMI|nr:Hypothetical protein CINCED_3A014497 [Cinara cedri]